MIKLCAFADEASPEIDGQIAALKRNEINLIEVRGLNGVNIADITEEEARGYAAQFKAAGIKVWSIGSPIGKVDINEDFGEHLKLLHHILRLANIFETKRVRIFSFYNAYDKEDEVIQRLKTMIAVANAYGVHLCHENEKNVFGDTPERIGKIIDSVAGISIVYDPANFVEVGVSAIAAKSFLYGKIDYYHVKDAIASTGEIVPAGMGDGDIFDMISDLCRDEERVLTVEPHLRTFEGYSDIDPTEMKNKYVFSTNDEAFDAACRAIKKVISQCGYKEYNGEYLK